MNDRTHEARVIIGFGIFFIVTSWSARDWFGIFLMGLLCLLIGCFRIKRAPKREG
jgi:hypothetical protein